MNEDITAQLSNFTVITDGYTERTFVAKEELDEIKILIRDINKRLDELEAAEMKANTTANIAIIISALSIALTVLSLI